MAKAKELEFSMEVDGAGIFDLVAISKDSREMEILSVLKNDLLKEGKFSAAKQGRICLASIAAWIIYVSSITEICDTTNESGELH